MTVPAVRRVEGPGAATHKVVEGDCREGMRLLADESVHSVVTDPPYGLSARVDAETVLRAWLDDGEYAHERAGFMNRRWDSFVPPPSVWREAHRILKPGGFALVFAGTRMVDFVAMSVRLAGFDVVDTVHWAYGQGSPKGPTDMARIVAARDGGHPTAVEAVAFMRRHREGLGMSRADLERAIFGREPQGNVRNWEEGVSVPRPGLWPRIKDALGVDATPFDAGMERGDVETGRTAGDFVGWGTTRPRWQGERVERDVTSDVAAQWKGWAVQLKPSHEIVVVARKPFAGTLAGNLTTHGTGAFNADASRVPVGGAAASPSAQRRAAARSSGRSPGRPGEYGRSMVNRITPERYTTARDGEDAGRYPANTFLTHAADCVFLGERQVSTGTAVQRNLPEEGSKQGRTPVKAPTKRAPDASYGTDGTETVGDWDCGPSCPVAEMDACGHGTPSRFFHQPAWGPADAFPVSVYCPKPDSTEYDAGVTRPGGCTHPTVKPVELMRVLCRLVTRPGGVVVDPFAGSGTTGVAAALEGFSSVLIDDGQEDGSTDVAFDRVAFAVRMVETGAAPPGRPWTDTVRALAGAATHQPDGQGTLL